MIIVFYLYCNSEDISSSNNWIQMPKYDMRHFSIIMSLSMDIKEYSYCNLRFLCFLLLFFFLVNFLLKLLNSIVELMSSLDDLVELFLFTIFVSEYCGNVAFQSTHELNLANLCNFDLNPATHIFIYEITSSFLISF